MGAARASGLDGVPDARFRCTFALSSEGLPIPGGIRLRWQLWGEVKGKNRRAYLTLTLCPSILITEPFILFYSIQES